MPRPRGIRVATSHSYDSLEKAAGDAVRHLLGRHHDGPALPGMDLFEALDELAIPHAGVLVPLKGGVIDQLPPGELARSRWSPREGCLVIELTNETYADLENEGHRARFSLWHEVGHVWLHVGELLSREWIPHQHAVLARGRPRHSIPHDSEWQADSFAAAALVPLAYLRRLKAAGRLAPFSISADRAISEESAGYRIDNATRKQGL